MARQFGTLFEGLKRGEISRREFAQAAGAMGVSASVIALVGNNTVLGQTPEGSPGASPVSGEPLQGTRPDAGTEGQTRVGRRFPA